MDRDEISPEPHPDWTNRTTQNILRWTWYAHIYSFAVIFIIIALICLHMIIFKSCSNQHKCFVKSFMLSSITILCTTRAVMLLSHPYFSNEDRSLWQGIASSFNTSLGSASFTSSLGTLLYIIAVSTRITSKHRQPQLGRFVCGVTISNFAFFVTSDLTTIVSTDVGRIMKTVCQITFAFWGLLVSFGFAVSTYRLRRNGKATFEQRKNNATMKKYGKRLKTLVVLLAILSGMAAVIFILRISNAIIGVIMDKFMEPYTWFIMETSIRILEITSAIVILLVFHKDSKKGKNCADDGDRTKH